MMSLNKTSIEWVKNPDGTQGYTWNPITGCLNHINGMCKGGGFPCYAYRLATTRLRERYLKGGIVSADCSDEDYLQRIADPFYPRFWPGGLLDGRDELCNAKPRGIFVCDMSDLFGVPEDWTRRVLRVIKDRSQHRFYLLTKQPQNLPQWSPFPDNCRVGVTATGARYFKDARRALLSIEAKVRYISFEPLLEYIPMIKQSLDDINWLIIGAQTRPTVYPKIEWVEEIVEAANKAGVQVFLKDNLEPLLEEAKFTGNHNLFWRDGYYTDITHPEVDLHLRQEMPE